MPSILEQMSLDLMLPPGVVEHLIRSAPHRYKVYDIPKRSGGGTRTIAQPAREAKRLQYWVLANLLKDIQVHEAATAYRKGLGTRLNAEAHAQNPYLLKLDFKDFFPSIKDGDFREFARSNLPDIVEEDVHRLARLLFWKPKGRAGLRLSIGAPTSPHVSNILMYEFDSRVATFCEERAVTYTRYADDLAFSFGEKGTSASVLEAVCEAISTVPWPRLRLNDAKTVFASRACRRRVTGLVLSNDGAVSLGREKKRQIRAAVHHFSHGDLDAQESEWLKGILAYARDVEPEFVERLEEKYQVLP